MPQPYTVICADRETGAEYPIVVTADSPPAAIAKAAKAGHITSRIAAPGAAPSVTHAAAPAEHHPTETDELLRTLIREVHAARAEASAALSSLATIADFARHNRPLTRKVASGVILAMLVWSLLVGALSIVLYESAREAARRDAESTFRR